MTDTSVTADASTNNQTGTTPPVRPRNQRILLLLSEMLLKRLGTKLRTRFTQQELTVPIEPESLPEKKQNEFQWLLRFPWNLPKPRKDVPVNNQLVFRVPGMAKLRAEKLPHPPDERTKNLINRFHQLRSSLDERCRKPGFLKLVGTDAVLREKQREVEALKTKLEQLNTDINKVDKPYYQAISYIFSTAIERLTGVAVLEKLMKGLIRIMLIDELEKRTIEGLVQKNYSRKYLSYMSTKELEQKYRAYKQDHMQDAEGRISIGEFIFKSPEFEKVDIVFFNRWDFDEDNFFVPVALRKKTILSKQEQRKANQKPEYVEKQIEQEETGLQSARERLEEVLKEIKRMEKSHEDDESKYQGQLSSRKRIIKDINRRETRLKSLKRPIKMEDQASIVKFDLYETFKDNQSFMDRLGDKVSGWGLDTLWEKHMNPDDRFSFVKLQEMSKLAKEWIHTKSMFDKLSSSTDNLSDQLIQFSAEHDLLVREARSRTAEPGNYQPLLDEHILDSLELAAICCEIVNSFERVRQAAKEGV